MQIDDPTPKSFLDHLEDLRWAIFRGLGAFVVVAGLCFAFPKPLLAFLYAPLRRAGQDPGAMLRVLGVVDPLSIQIDMALLGGLVGSLPFLLFFLAQFLLPGLTRREARLLVPAFIAGAFLFMGGVAFCYQWILPETLRFFIAYNAHLDFRTEWTVQNYIDFVLQMFLAFGLSFELPLVLLALNRLGLIRAETLRQSRRHAVVILVVLASCVVPATDPFSIGMLVVPMYLLFEVTVWLATLFERRLAAAEKAS